MPNVTINAKTLRRFNPFTKEYDLHTVPLDWKVIIYHDNLDININCASCGKELRYGDSFTSLEIHNKLGMGYCVCEECYKREWERQTKAVSRR